MPTSSARGFKLHFVEEGDGHPVVFAHGFTMDHVMYAPQFEELPDRYRCVAWDMRGHGRSECPDGPWSIQDFVDDLAEFIEDVDAAPCHLVGMSLGGMTAVRLAIQRPDLLSALVLIDTTADAEDPATAEAYRAFQAQIEAEDGISEELGRATLPIFYAQAFIDAEPETMDYHVERELAMPMTAAFEGLRALIERDSVVSQLHKVNVPTLVIHGELDAAIPMAKAEELALGIVDAELIKVPDAGHTTTLEAPDVVNEALAGFFLHIPN